MIKESIGKIIAGKNLTQQEAFDTMSEIMSGNATEAQIASFITALRMKGETIDEITGCAKVMRQFATHVEMATSGIDVIADTCGTGGDSLKTFNISTVSAFVTAGAGVHVAKHGNRAVSSSCGSADLIESLGIKLELTKEQAEECLKKVGIVFLFAPVWHGAMKYAVGPRKQIGIRTIFNILGPLSNPAGAANQVIGVYDVKLTDTLAEVLKNLGSKHAFVVHGMDSLDEITITGKTRVAELKNGRIRAYYVTPEKFGIKRSTLDEIEGADAVANAGITMAVLKGEKTPRRDVVLMNASAALVAGSMARDFKSGVKMAAESIDSGRALDKLNRLIEITNR